MGWYGVIIVATAAYWLGNDSAAAVLGWFFAMTATLVLVNGILWALNRGRRPPSLSSEV